MKKKKKDKEMGVNEPEGEYSGMTLKFFKSFEEENEDTHRGYAELKPEECLAIVTKKRLLRFPYLNTNLNSWGNNIYFDKK